MCSTLLGPATVVWFNALRTLSRVVVQFGSILSLPLWQEFAHLYAKREHAELKLLFKRSGLAGIILSLIAGVALLGVAPIVLSYWTGGAVPWMPGTSMALIAAASIATTAYVPRVLLLATNKHALVAMSHLVFGLIGLAAAWFLIEVATLG